MVKLEETLRKGNKAFSEAILAECLEPLKKAAKARGYALMVHGSLSRDIDILCVPWTKEAGMYDELANAIRVVFENHFGAACFSGEEGKKPHDRVAYTIILKGTTIFVDLSIFKPREQK